MRVLILLACLGALACAEKARYDNYVVYRVMPTTQEHLASLKQLQDYPDGLSFWSEAARVGAHANVMVPPHRQPEFKAMMAKAGMQMEVFIANVQENIDNEIPANAPKDFGWTSYYRLNEIYDWLDSLATTYPKQVTSIVGGRSFEGRQIRGVKISFGAGRPAFFLEGGIHAREWIASATITYILNEVLTSTDPAVRAVVEAYDWIVFPVVNPDGFEYSHTNDRLWRKTRSNAGGLCYGADPNRNWDFQWLTGGSSSSPCSDTYAGSSAFSEIETRTLSSYISSVIGKVDVYISIHSYGQYILFPYGTDATVIPNANEHLSVARRSAQAIEKVSGTKYTYGNIVDILYVASGGSIDWVKGKYNTHLAYTIELRDTGKYGFVLPADQIIPTAVETLPGVLSILSDALLTRS